MAIQQWSDVQNLIAQNISDGNFSAPTFNNTVDYAIHHTGDAIRAAEEAVGDYVPTVLSHLIPKLW
ncbi:hypothetical protein EI067_15365 [Mycobacterium paragordonae]|uniref:hypothetical protein n=1 Tax=Mycobacterium paragordonae TaxID=1389713 RepID=UPI00105D6996|nr:hypothetical protein [Mycobacterium paragordonae]TDK96480.1 hypothetical protein EI067_15365 [Mycobacterium paragordonae]